MSFSQRIVAAALVIVALVAAIGSPFVYREWRSYQRFDFAKQCREAQIDRRWEDLQSLADRWSSWDSDNGEAWMFRGRAASGRRDWSAAASYFWQVPESDSRSIPAMIELSKIAFAHLNEPLKGVEAAQRILRNDPHASVAQKQLIDFYATTLQRDKLLRQIHTAIREQSEPRESYVYAFLLYTLRSKGAVELNEHWLERSPDEEIFLVARALQLPEPKSKSQEAPASVPAGDQSMLTSERSKMDLIDELLTRFPQNIELLAYKAEDRVDAGDLDGATSLLSKAPDAAKRDGRFWRIKGWIHESHDELDDAATAYRRALELHSVDWNAMNRLAVVERRLQNVAEVERLTKLVERAQEIRQLLRKTTEMEMVTPSILVELAKFYRDCGDRVIGPALERRLSRVQAR